MSLLSNAVFFSIAPVICAIVMFFGMYTACLNDIVMTNRMDLLSSIPIKDLGEIRTKEG